MSDVHIDHGELAQLEPQLLDRVEAACRTHEIDVVLPADLPSMRLVSRYGAHIRSARIAAVPHAQALEHLVDRWHFTRTLAALGLPHARTELVTDAIELRETRLRFPILTRPRGAPERARRYDSLAALVAGLLDGELDRELPLLAEELIPGKPVGFLFLARHGQLLSHTAYEPRAANAWRFFEARELRDHVAIWIASLGYHGLGQIEARYDAERHQFRLMGLHPSFGESLLFAKHAGMNLPDLLVRMPDVGPGAGFVARPRPVSLSYYERGVAGMIRLAARAEALLPLTGSRIRD